MELFRIGRNPWNQEILQGVSWDLLWVFAGAGLFLIAAHMLFRAVWVSGPGKR